MAVLKTLALDIRDLYRYRALIWTLVVKELKLRYRGSVLGFFWSFLNPLLLMAVYALVFSVYMRIQMEHYPVFMFCGLLPWITVLWGGAISSPRPFSLPRFSPW